MSRSDQLTINIQIGGAHPCRVIDFPASDICGIYGSPCFSSYLTQRSMSMGTTCYETGDSRTLPPEIHCTRPSRTYRPARHD